MAPAVAMPAQEPTRPQGQTLAGVTHPARPSNVINMILVKVNGDPIMLTDLETVERDRMEMLRQQIPESEIQAQLLQLRERFLAGLIDEKMMAQRADALGITADANLVDSQIRRLRDTNDITTDEEFEQALAEAGITFDALRDQVRRTLRQQQLVQQEVNRSIFVSEIEVAQYYNDHPEQFEAPAQVRLRQLIFITGGGDPTALRQQAEAALVELQGGADYSGIGAKYTNGTPMTGEDTFIAMDELNESLATTVPDMGVGTYSLVESQFGYHLVSVLERQERATIPLADVMQSILQRITAEKSQKAIGEYLVGLRDGTELKILDQTYINIAEAWKAPPEESVEGR